MISRLTIFKRYLRHLFDLKATQEDETITYEEIKAGVIFKGTNLWILALAMIISCVGLNINSKGAVIGAMIISPLMGPVFGIGFALATSDIDLLKLSFKNILRIVSISISFSSLYYFLNPYTIATDELLSFSKPTFFDVVLAFAGGVAGMIAISRHNGTQVLIGVAVATACIPPLCTAGFGIATWQLNYFIGGLYTYLINALFIGLGAYFVVRYLKFRKRSATEVKNIGVWFTLLTVITVAPALYLAYDLAKGNIFSAKVTNFINAGVEKKYHVLQFKISPEAKTIEVDVLVDKYDPKLPNQIAHLKHKFKLDEAQVKVYQTVEAGKGNRAELDALHEEIKLLKEQIGKQDKLQNQVREIR